MTAVDCWKAWKPEVLQILMSIGMVAGFITILVKETDWLIENFKWMLAFFIGYIFRRQRKQNDKQ
ncbi:hypothetical protein CMO91_04080 [Candidatus Woesearchaeota archaeon]|nr:hypothetical protein [Candidatus Woesearchaeota archaeon]|tara:strand:- start:169 stop:363 length:195 start_codon:yes stop_codon:yes gene_type:complete